MLIGMPPSKKSKMHTVSPSFHSVPRPLHRLPLSLDPSISRMSPTIPDSAAPCIDCPPDDIVYRVVKNIDSNRDLVEVGDMYLFLLWKTSSLCIYS